MNTRQTHAGSGKVLRVDTRQQVADVRYWLSIADDRERPGSWRGQLWATGPDAEALKDPKADEFVLVTEDGTSGRILLGRRAGSLGGSAFGVFFTGVSAPPA